MLANADIKKNFITTQSMKQTDSDHLIFQDKLTQAWKTIGAFWPLKHLIAANPLQGFEDLPFEEALTQGARYFQQKKLPETMQAINRQTIKWCQAFFDEDQATISMPNRNLGLYHSWKRLAVFDAQLTHSNANCQSWLIGLPESAEETISYCLSGLKIPEKNSTLFLTLLLTTLPGWASYINYQTDWNKEYDKQNHPISKADYLAMRIATAYLLWKDAKDLLAWHDNADIIHVSKQLTTIIQAEQSYQASLLGQISANVNSLNPTSVDPIPIAQLVFCIDVRSEPFRHALEAQGNYDTYGFAGFFGLPVRITNEVSEQSYASCPVLLTPTHTVTEKLDCSHHFAKKVHEGKQRITLLKRCYQSLKYTFTSPLTLVETLGPWSGLWMAIKTMLPKQAKHLKQAISNVLQPPYTTHPILKIDHNNTGIDFENQCHFAENALRMIGLIDGFSELVILCGHGAQTENNAYASALDCGACGGHEGGSNAKILASILNDNAIRHYLETKNINIPVKTVFIAAEHNTTTDDVKLFMTQQTQPTVHANLQFLTHDLQKAKQRNCEWRCQQMGSIHKHRKPKNAIDLASKLSLDWAQTRPEWGLARNAAFIVGPRKLTKAINLEGRCFLHSYDWKIDTSGSSLTTILTAPMIVAQWINSQYLFSTLDNVAFGSGSKITHNITGKIGVMQGNGSDFMHGLPLQSVNRSDQQAYHQPLRLMTLVYAPRQMISDIITQHAILQKLLGNGWVTLTCIEPEDNTIYCLTRDFQWKKCMNDPLSH